MGFRRLSILDLTENGRQPMSFSGGRFHLTFNGEIYNYAELRKELGGVAFRSSGDTEILGESISRNGIDATLSRLRGMFAFAWWDDREKTLKAGRDPFGIKPLYYHVDGDGGLLVSSEIRPLCWLLGNEARLSSRAVAQFFHWGAVQAPGTILEGVSCVRPGHLLLWDAKGVRTRPYFKPEWNPSGDLLTDEKACRAAVRKTVLDSVRAHLVSDVPVGVFLSGGLDSSIMAAAMKHLGVARLEAFSVGYEGDAGVPDESSAARRTADFLGAEFRLEKVSSTSLEAAFDHFISHLDQPSGDALNTYLVARIAARHVKVTISGLGADEWFAGYNSHRMMALAHVLPVGPLAARLGIAALVREITVRLPASLRIRREVRALNYILGASGLTPAQMQAASRMVMPRDEIGNLLARNGDVPRHDFDPDHWDEVVSGLASAAPGSWLNQILLLETQSYLANTLLRDCDCMSMAHGLELRVPFVDREVWALAGRVPPHLKLRGARGKYILREAFRDLLPPWINDDRNKKTFTLPLMRWLKTPCWRDRVNDTLRSRRCQERGWLSPRAVERHLDQFYRLRDDSKRSWTYSQRVWLMFVLESWACAHLDAEPSPGVRGPGAGAEANRKDLTGERNQPTSPT